MVFITPPHGKGGYSREGRALATLGIAPTEIAIANIAIDRNVIPFCKPHINDAARRVATVFEKWNCKIETCLPTRRREALHKD